MVTPRANTPDWSRESLATIGVVVLAGMAYSAGHFLEPLATAKAWASWLPSTLETGAIVILALGTSGNAIQWIDKFRSVRSQRAAAAVDVALKSVQTAGHNVATVSADVVAQYAGNVKVGKAQLNRLVEQRKQKFLIDDAAFGRDVGNLFVDYLQPLPRNAKRVLNRFRVSVLIAFHRHLLDTNPDLVKTQIGKWLVLAERWPQLRQSLSATPHRIAELEAAEAREFTALLRTLAPAYIDDLDLHAFLRSEPKLVGMLEQLVHYGVAHEDDVTSVTAAQTNALLR